MFPILYLPFGTYLPRTPGVMIPKLSTCSRIFCQCQNNIHVDLVWQLWMGGGGLMVILQVVVDSIPYLLHGWRSVRDEYKFFCQGSKLLSISAKGSGGAWGDGTHIDRSSSSPPQVGLWIQFSFGFVSFPKWDYEFNSVLGLCQGKTCIGMSREFRV